MEAELDSDEVIKDLNAILEAELSGVVRYTHYSLMVTGPNRIPLVDFLKAQATESLVHAQEVGEILTGFGGHPSTNIAAIEETNNTQSVTSSGRAWLTKEAQSSFTVISSKQ